MRGTGVLAPVADRIDFVHGDIADLELVDELVSGVDAWAFRGRIA